MPTLALFAHAAAVFTALSLVTTPLLAAEKPIPWTDEQARAAGVSTEPARLIAAGSASGQHMQGTVVLPPQSVVVVSTPLAGVVQETLIGPGQHVKPNEVLARIVSPQLLEIERDAMQAQAEAELAASRLRRDEKLFAEGIIANARLEETRGEHRIAQLKLAQQRRTVELTGAAQQRKLDPALELRSPAEAVVSEVLATPGQRLDAGAPVVRLQRGGRVSIEIQASVSQANQLRVGDALAVQGCAGTATLTAISPQVNPANQTVLVRADHANEQGCLRVHQFVRLSVESSDSASAQADSKVAAGAPGATDQSGGLRIPASAVVRQGGAEWVFVRRPEGYVPTSVTTRISDDGWVSVTQGLAAGDEVVVRGVAALKGAWQGLGAE